MSSTINDFRVYKLDNSKLDASWSDSDILQMINIGTGDEFEKITGDINFSILNNKIKFFNFNGIKVDSDDEGPLWLSYLGMLGDSDTMESIQSQYVRVKIGILSVLKIGTNYYIISYGNAHHSLPTTMLDEDFGINLSKKFITKQGKVRGISQAVIKGDLESTYKSIKNTTKYNAMEDSSNLGKKTKNLKGVGNSKEIFYDIPQLQGISINLDSNKGIKIDIGGIDQGVDKTIFAQVMEKIDYFHNLNFANSYKIPDLERINSKHINYGTLISEIKLEINKTNNENVYSSPALFYSYLFDSLYYSPEIISFIVTDGSISITYECNTNGNFENLDLIKFLKDNSIDLSKLEDISFKSVKFKESDGTISSSRKRPKLLDILQGEFEHNGEIYFFESLNFYKPNQDFKDIVVSNFDRQIVNFKLDDPDFLHEWDICNSTTLGKHEEANFNFAHDPELDTVNGKDGFYCFDKGVSGLYGMDTIEICDLIKKQGNDIYFIHVKRNHGADLRVLFSQGRVGTDKMLEDTSVTSKHINSNSKLTLRSPTISNKNFFVVYAIKNPNTRDPFTLYAKYDFISTLQQFRDKGIDNVRVYNIK